MKLPVHRFQSLLIHVRINLRGGNVGVPEHLLNDPQISAVAQKMRRETVPQQVRINIRLQTRPRRCFLHNLPNAHRRQFRPAR